MEPRLLELGDAALTLEFGQSIDAAVSRRVTAAAAALRRLPLAGITDLVPTWRSLTVHFDPLRLPRRELAEILLTLPGQAEEAEATARSWRLPVVFGGEYGPDLDAVAAATGRSAEEIVATLCALPLRVFLVGFLPGFPYMGELPEWLRLPRLATPRTAVPARSVAIAGAQAAIYPWASPGGWHLLGRTPVALFDAAMAERPALLLPGDSVRFHAIGADEHQRLLAAPPAQNELFESS